MIQVKPLNILPDDTNYHINDFKVSLKRLSIDNESALNRNMIQFLYSSSPNSNTDNTAINGDWILAKLELLQIVE